MDVGSATIKLEEDGVYALSIGAADMGTGCDTTMAQVAAECLDCSIEQIIVSGADTDTSPYDSGSYASSTAYITGKAVEKACRKLQEKICEKAASMLGCEVDAVEFDGHTAVDRATGKQVDLKRNRAQPDRAAMQEVFR